MKLNPLTFQKYWPHFELNYFLFFINFFFGQVLTQNLFVLCYLLLLCVITKEWWKPDNMSITWYGMTAVRDHSLANTGLSAVLLVRLS